MKEIESSHKLIKDISEESLKVSLHTNSIRMTLIILSLEFQRTSRYLGYSTARNKGGSGLADRQHKKELG